MKKMVSGLACVAGLFAAANAGTIVRHPEGAAPAREWAPPLIMGRTFWPVLTSQGLYQFGRLPDHPIFKECGIQFVGENRLPVSDVSRGKGWGAPVPPERQRKTPYGLRDFFPVPWTVQKLCDVTNRPVFLHIFASRPCYLLNPVEKGYPLADVADFAQWKRKHPNFMGFDAAWEFDSEAWHFTRWMKTNPQMEAARRLAKEFPLPEDGNGQGRNLYGWMRTVHDRERAFHFGDATFWPLASYVAACLHHFAACGASGIWYEATTDSNHGHWALAAAYLRGAARQFGIPYGWYTASYYCGYTRDGMPTRGYTTWLERRSGDKVYTAKAPNHGTGRSLLDRLNVYGWLIGSSFTHPEHWTGLFIDEDGEGKRVFSGEGRDFVDLFELSKRADRGVPVTPVAFLVPIEESMMLDGRSRELRDRFSQQAFFQTLFPVFCGEPGTPFRKKGEQGGFFNSKFADAADILTPDSGQRRSAFLAALKRYPVAFIVGSGFSRKSMDFRACEEYVRSGGTLVVSCDQIRLGLVPPTVSGVSFDGAAVPSGKFFTDEAGRSFPLEGEYLVETGSPQSARPWLRDDAGNVLAWGRNLGRGRVVSLACAHGLPSRYDEGERLPEDAYMARYAEIGSCRARFALLEYLFRRVQDETLPVRVEGDALYGVNKTREGYLVWIFNNRGVTKFTDEPESYDQTRTATVRVDMKDMVGARVVDLLTGRPVQSGVRSCSVDVPPGGYRLLRIIPRAGTAPKSARRVTSLDGAGWSCDGEAVSVPHTWNTADGADGARSAGLAKSAATDSASASTYLRKRAKYRRALPGAIEGRRYFVRCKGASIRACVRVNGSEIGRHDGAFTAFCFEATDAMKPTGNELEVEVDNTYSPDSLPVAADFTMYGGLYRGVDLIETPLVCIDPTIDGSSGVRIEPDAKTGNVVAHVSVSGAPDEVRTFTFPNPVLWTPENPKLYSVRVEIASGDAVSVPFGFRTVEVRDDGLYLNGAKCRLHGVNYHQDRLDRGWAVTEAEQVADIRQIRDMGANAVRTAHYPHSDAVYDACDREGLLAWVETPNVEYLTDSPAYREHSFSALREMVAQLGHHPSIFVWGMSNELETNRVPAGTCAPFLRALQNAAKGMDGSRPCASVTWKPTEREMNAVPEVLGLNLYPGWYRGNADEMADSLEKARAATSRPSLVVTEYGAGGNVDCHERCDVRNAPTAPFHSEEYQALVHHDNYLAICGDSRVWGSFVWLMYDFGADGRREGSRFGVNDKGLVAGDHATAKDAYYFYRANWNPSPLLHLVGRRMTVTTNGLASVMGFWNGGGDVELSVNGRSLGRRSPDAVKTVQWRGVALRLGDNEIELSAGGLARKATWVLSDLPCAPAKL